MKFKQIIKILNALRKAIKSNSNQETITALREELATELYRFYLQSQKWSTSYRKCSQELKDFNLLITNITSNISRSV